MKQEKVIHPFDLKVSWHSHAIPVFLSIEFDTDKGELSISGVEGPKSNGDAIGSSGQIVMGYAHRNPKDNDDRTAHLHNQSDMIFMPGWNYDQWLDLVDVWEQWHLNDMRAGCVHQRAEWDTQEKLEVVSYGLTTAAYQLRNKLQEQAGRATARGEMLELDDTERALLSLDKWYLDRYSPPDADDPLSGCYEVKKREIKSAGWVTEEEHPRGLLSRPCPVCGYKYGSAWLHEDVPQSVLDWLSNLPDTDRSPAWV